MQTGFSSQCRSTYRTLSEGQIAHIHQASLTILETVGIRVENETGRRLLEEAGCGLNAEGNLLIPGDLVERCIQSAPSGITIYDQAGGEAMRLEGRNTHFGLGTDLIKTWDMESGQLRLSRLGDVVNAARVADFCSDIDFVASYALPHEVDPNLMYIRCFEAMIENTTKPIFFTAAGREDLAVIVEIAACVAGGEERLRQKPFLIHYAETYSPLTHTHSGVEKLFLCADKGLPVNYTQGMLMGASGPVTVAGAIAVANAEALSGVVLHQLRSPGAPIISGLAVVPLDMRTTIFSYGSPEYRLTDAAYADLFHHYGLPMWGTAGCSDAACLDEQAAAEASVTILLSALSGANLVHDVGYLGQGLIGHPAAIVMCDELISYVRRFVQGFEINADTIPLDLIRRVGPKGNYLAEDHTLEHFRREFWQPRYANRHNPDAWVQNGSPVYGDQVVDKARRILATHAPRGLDPHTGAQVAEIVAEAQQRLSQKHFST